MKRHGNIYHKICSLENLRLAHKMARKDKLFYKEVKVVDSDPETYLKQIQAMLLNESYDVSEYAYSEINDKGKVRQLAKLPYFPDRIIQWAIMLQIELVFTEVFCTHTCASLPDRGISGAMKLMFRYLKDEENTRYALKIDISKFYPSINHRILKLLLKRKFKDKALLRLLFRIIDSVPGDKGVPIGSYLSQYLANYYLAYFDHWMKENMKLHYVVRYMDDVIVMAKSKEELHIVRRTMDEYLAQNLDLRLKDNWQVFPVDVRGVDFIGFRFFHGYTLLRKRTCKRMKKTMLKIREKQKHGQLINYSEWCSVNSYIGWLGLCNGWRLMHKYITPIAASLVRYYREVVLRDMGDTKRQNRLIRYSKKLVKKGMVIQYEG